MTNDNSNSQYKDEPALPSRDFSDYPIKLFVDANVVLEGKQLVDLPWADIDGEGPILVLLLPQTLAEIDSKKPHGRLGRIARAFNRLIAPVATGGPPIIIHEAAPRVVLALASCNRIPWSDYDDLDPEDGDSRVVAEILHVRDVPSDEKILVSQDIKPLAIATRYDLRTHHISEAWLRQPEPTPQDKTIQKLQQQVRDLKKNEPEFEIQIEIGQSSPTKVYRITDLSPEERAEIESTILRKNPKPNQERNDYRTYLDSYDSGLDDRYDTYRDTTVPSFASVYESKIELLFNQVSFSIQVSNTGQIRADKCVIEIESSEGWINDSFVFVSSFGPSAPSPRHGLFDLHRYSSDIQPIYRAGRHEVELVEGPDRSQRIAANCEDFRHGQIWIFEGVLGLDSDIEGPATISVRVTAANLHGAASGEAKVQKSIEKLHVFDLIDRETLRAKRDLPMQAILEQITKDEDFYLLDFDE